MTRFFGVVLSASVFAGVQIGVYVGADFLHRKQDSISAYANLTHRAKMEIEALRAEEAYYEQLQQRHRRLADCLAAVEKCED